MATTRGDPTVPATREDSRRGWIPVAAIAGGELLLGGAFGYAFLTSGVSLPTVALGTSLVLAALLLPFVIYRDYRRLERAGRGWDADLARYIGAAMVGPSLPVVSVAVATVYLVQRRDATE